MKENIGDNDENLRKEKKGHVVHAKFYPEKRSYLDR
jgi:hypothetical protein